MGRNSRSRGGAWEIPYCIGRRPIFQPLTMNAGWEVEGSEKVSLPAADCSAPCSGTCRARPGLAQGDAAGGNEGSQGYSVHLGRKMQSSAGKKEEKKTRTEEKFLARALPSASPQEYPPKVPSSARHCGALYNAQHQRIPARRCRSPPPFAPLPPVATCRCHAKNNKLKKKQKKKNHPNPKPRSSLTRRAAGDEHPSAAGQLSVRGGPLTFVLPGPGGRSPALPRGQCGTPAPGERRSAGALSHPPTPLRAPAEPRAALPPPRQSRARQPPASLT